ncbi:mandelate racemase/muconate lactonizing enzyme family protein [Acuticoccus sp. M5D2P5]|uniref:mandelate racemase/muconate lactonizing enzyme family protein n=1 Tax=Acuticoccus kalidii TaxID=2910977 RepID=UPI001F17A803|nr:mandelate racemase/muconate lactonizing enzyme family protein [Acuticoccus kalidii]MCF3932812.1 mandelate racemase/muconate lactonizing enzyme family protein [Acuticoccus kalidii]
MKIEAVDVAHYHVPLPVPLSDSTHGIITHFDLVVVHIRDTDGADGFGYTYTVGAGGDAIRSLCENDLKPTLIGADADAIEAIWQKNWWHLHYVGRGGAVSFAMAAIDVALWDLKAKRAKLPLYRFLGGDDPAVSAYVGGVDLQFPTDKLIAQASEAIAGGIRAIKMKVGRARLAEDIERVAAMRAHIGPDITLMADANMIWRMDEAIRAARALATYDLFWIEEPTIPEDVAGHTRIVRDGGLPVATGENFHSIHEFARFIEAEAVSFPEPDAATLGGVTPWLKVAHLAEANNLPVTTHGIHDLHVHLLAAVPNSSYLEIHGFSLNRFLEEPLRIEEGKAHAPDRPGHGILLDFRRLTEHRAG